MTSIRALIVDDHVVVRSGLVGMLEDSDVEVAGQATDGDEAITATKELGPDVVLLDIRMPKQDGFAALERILGNC